MCEKTIHDVYCHSNGCYAIVAYNLLAKREPCDQVFDDNLAFGACGDTRQTKIDARKATDRNMTCSGCKENARKHSQELYNNVGQRIAAEREHQRQLDDQRRARREAQSFPTHGGTDYGHFGYGHVPYTLDQLSFEDFNALLADDTPDAGWEDPGEGSSRGSGGRDSRRGGQRHG